MVQVFMFSQTLKKQMNMNTSFRYELDRTSKKFNCRSCGKKRLVRYVNLETKEYLPEEFGRCDREQNCGYWLKPGSVHVQLNPKRMNEHEHLNGRKYIPTEIFKSSRTAYDRNGFIQYLLTIAGPECIADAIKKYQIGTCRAGSIFWFIDHRGNICAGQVKQFDATGHTVKDSTTWVHSLLKSQPWAKEYADQERKVSCLYGAHLLKQYDLPVALCEAPKTAIIASLYFPEMLWLASGSKSYLTEDRTSILKGRDVTLFPDLGAYDQWKAYGNTHGWKTSYYLEEIATEDERVRGLDLADFLTRESVHVHSAPRETVEHEHQEPYTEALLDGREILMHPKGFPMDWNLKTA
jgi:hypothetical protein